MKHVQKFAFGMLALMAIGCGGSGNGPAPVVTVINSTPRVEAIVKVLSTNLKGDITWTPAQLLNPQTPGLQADLINPTVFGVQDPNNIEAGEHMVFQLVTYSTDSSGNLIRTVLPNVNFASSDTTGVYGSLAGDSGDFTAGNSRSTANLTITAFYNGVAYQTFYAIKIDQVRLIGNVLAQGTNANQLAGSRLQFFDGGGALVDTVTVQFDGSFRASIPTTTTTFTVVADSVPQEYFQSFNYLSLQYDAGVVGCFAPTPSGLSIGTTSLPGTVYVPVRVPGETTPAATGCTVSGGAAHIIKNR